MSIYSTEEKVLELGIPDPELAALLKESPHFGNVPQSYELKDVDELRRQVAAMRPSFCPPNADVEEFELKAPARDGYMIQMRCYRLKTLPKEGCALIINFHGGGFFLGDLQTDADFCRSLVTNHKAIVVDVDYRLSPEHPFPVPTNDCWDAVLWISKNFDTLQANPSLGFLVSGVSAGASIASVMSLLARDHALSPPLTGAFLSALPAASTVGVVPEKYRHLWLSRKQNAQAPILNEPLYRFIEDDCYKPDHSSFLSSPLAHPQGHSDLPRTYFLVCGMDPLRDGALIYETMLRADSGVETAMDVFPGLPHCWWSIFPQLSSTSDYHVKVGKALDWLLRKTDSITGQV